MKIIAEVELSQVFDPQVAGETERTHEAYARTLIRKMHRLAGVSIDWVYENMLGGEAGGHEVKWSVAWQDDRHCQQDDFYVDSEDVQEDEEELARNVVRDLQEMLQHDFDEAAEVASYDAAEAQDLEESEVKEQVNTEYDRLVRYMNDKGGDAFCQPNSGGGGRTEAEAYVTGAFDDAGVFACNDIDLLDDLVNEAQKDVESYVAQYLEESEELSKEESQQ